MKVKLRVGNLRCFREENVDASSVAGKLTTRQILKKNMKRVSS